jgi:hypothetical protein
VAETGLAGAPARVRARSPLLAPTARSANSAGCRSPGRAGTVRQPAGFRAGRVATVRRPPRRTAPSVMEQPPFPRTNRCSLQTEGVTTIALAPRPRADSNAGLGTVDDVRLAIRRRRARPATTSIERPRARRSGSAVRDEKSLQHRANRPRRGSIPSHKKKAQANQPGNVYRKIPAPKQKADARTRTGDPFITSEVLYQLSYVGE